MRQARSARSLTWRTRQLLAPGWGHERRLEHGSTRGLYVSLKQPALGPLKIELDHIDWAYESGTYQALGHRFAVRTTHLRLGKYLGSLFQHFAVSSRAQQVAFYSLTIGEETEHLPFALYRDGEMLGKFRSGSGVLARLIWHINHRAIQDATEHLLLHASAAEWKGRTLIFPAPMESGKTTLVAGLVRAGFGYVTDEAVAIDPVTSMVDAFPRALSIDQGSWEVLNDLRPTLEPEIEDFQGDQWQVPPDSIRPGAVVHRSQPRFVIEPRYRGGSETRLLPMRRAEAVQVMGENAFNFQDFGDVGLRALSSVARGSLCYRLEIGDLDHACSLVANLVEASVSDREGDRS